MQRVFKTYISWISETIRGRNIKFADNMYLNLTQRQFSLKFGHAFIHFFKWKKTNSKDSCRANMFKFSMYKDNNHINIYCKFNDDRLINMEVIQEIWNFSEGIIM